MRWGPRRAETWCCTATAGLAPRFEEEKKLEKRVRRSEQRRWLWAGKRSQSGFWSVRGWAARVNGRSSSKGWVWWRFRVQRVQDRTQIPIPPWPSCRPRGILKFHSLPLTSHFALSPSLIYNLPDTGNAHTGALNHPQDLCSKSALQQAWPRGDLCMKTAPDWITSKIPVQLLTRLSLSAANFLSESSGSRRNALELEAYIFAML